MAQQEYSGEKPVTIMRGRVDSLTLYEVTDYEVDLLEKGSPNSIYLNFSIFLISLGTSFLVALLTTDIQSVKLFTIFVVITVLGLVVGIFLLILWYRTRTSMSAVVRRIRGRVQASTSEAGEGGGPDAQQL